jgi:threonine/homoserine/homoserine lactone efflux protein
VNESFQILATLAAAQVVLNLSPGPNMLLVVHAGAHDRRLGYAVAAGIWPVGILWAIAGLAGLGSLLTAVPALDQTMRIACGLYLVWLGVKAIRRSFTASIGAAASTAEPMTLAEAFRAGVLTNLTNPKSVGYYMSIFAATGSFELSAVEQAVAVTMMPTISFLWNVTLATFVSSRPIAAVLDRGRSWFDRLAGLTMIGFGARLLASRH